MSRGSRLRILLGSCIIGSIGVFAHSTLLIIAAVALLVLSCVRYSTTPPTNYREKFGPPDPDESSNALKPTPFTEVRPKEDESHAN